MLSSPASLEDSRLVADLGLEAQDDSALGMAVPARGETEVSFKRPCSPGATFPRVQVFPFLSKSTTNKSIRTPKGAQEAVE